MLRTLKDLFNAVTTPAETPAQQEHSLQLATAVLLVEVMRADAGTSAQERATVLQLLQAKFELTADELARLVELAERTVQTSSDFHQFTSLINERFGQDMKIRIVENMWRVAYANGHVDANEHHVIAKVAGLLHVTHGEYIAAKLHAKDDATAAAGQHPAGKVPGHA